MNKRVLTKEGPSLVSKLLVPLAGTLAFGSIISFQVYAEEGMVFRVLLLCIGLGISLTLLFLSPTGRNFIIYFKDSIQEVKRVVWPTKKETLQTVVMVFLFVLLSAIFLWLADKFFEWVLYSMVLGWK